VSDKKRRKQEETPRRPLIASHRRHAEQHAFTGVSQMVNVEVCMPSVVQNVRAGGREPVEDCTGRAENGIDARTIATVQDLLMSCAGG